MRLNCRAMKDRCKWPGEDPLYIAYHDEEWGVTSHDDRHLFEMLILEGAQAYQTPGGIALRFPVRLATAVKA